jgi:replicative DNA helicase
MAWRTMILISLVRESGEYLPESVLRQQQGKNRDVRDAVRLRSTLLWAQPDGLQQMVRAAAGSGRKSSMYEDASAASDWCKTIAMELGLPVLGLSRLSRSVETRDPPVPAMSDLRESGKLEEDADAVILTYRPEYYLRRRLDALDEKRKDERIEIETALSGCQNRVDLIVAKQRSGPTGTVPAWVDMPTCHLSATPIGGQVQAQAEMEGFR